MYLIRFMNGERKVEKKKKQLKMIMDENFPEWKKGNNL